jgi:hypothetical protein
MFEIMHSVLTGSANSAAFVLSMYEVCSKSIRIGIVVAVHWVGCVCNQS